VQCRGAVQSSSNRLVRLLGVDSEPVNHGWLCDKGRYGLEWIHSDRRLLEPQVRDGGTRREVSWPDALDRAADAIEKVKNLHGAGAIAVLGGARGTNEDAYMWSRLAKGVIGTDNVDAQLGDGLPADFVLGMARAEIADLDRARAIVVLDQDLRDQVPVLFLRVRRAIVELGVPLVDLAPVAHPLSARAAVVARTVPGETIAANVHDEITRVTAGHQMIHSLVGEPAELQSPRYVASEEKPQYNTGHGRSGSGRSGQGRSGAGQGRSGQGAAKATRSAGGRPGGASGNRSGGQSGRPARSR